MTTYRGHDIECFHDGEVWIASCSALGLASISDFRLDAMLNIKAQIDHSIDGDAGLVERIASAFCDVLKRKSSRVAGDPETTELVRSYERDLGVR